MLAPISEDDKHIYRGISEAEVTLISQGINCELTHSLSLQSDSLYVGG